MRKEKAKVAGKLILLCFFVARHIIIYFHLFFFHNVRLNHILHIITLRRQKELIFIFLNGKHFSKEKNEIHTCI